MPEEDLPIIDMALLEPVALLLQKRLYGEALLADELVVLDAWISRAPANRALFEKLEDPAALQQMLKTWHNIEQNRELNKEKGMKRVAALVNKTNTPDHKVRFITRRFLRYAAAAVLLLGVGTYWWILFRNTDHPSTNEHKLSAAIISPGHNGAVLTLADGSQVVLDSLGNGVVANQQGAQVSLQNGQLAYNATGSNDNTVVFNTVSTPKGRQFTLVLPDGSKVWLNAASSIKYPTAFTGNDRRIILEGEAYFEVAKNEKQPFIVAANDATSIEVLGTSFNVNAYRNETAIKTTLITGAVKVNAYQRSEVLKPGQQGQVNTAAAQLKVVDVTDLDQVTAWKNGLFDFDGANLQDVMRQLERWYDIEVVYPNGVPTARFGGEINKQNTLQDVLQILEKSDVHYRLEEGRKLIVLP